MHSLRPACYVGWTEVQMGSGEVRIRRIKKCSWEEVQWIEWTGHCYELIALYCVGIFIQANSTSLLCMNNVSLRWTFVMNFPESQYFFDILQNKLLHDRLEALHIQLTERDRSGGDSGFPDSGLQNVIGYLRRTKEIVMTSLSTCSHSQLPLAWCFAVCLHF